MSELRELYNELIKDHSRSPRNRRRLDDANRIGRGHNRLCGDVVTIYARIDDDVITDVAFEGDGCAHSLASASLMTQALKGRTVDEAEALFKKFYGLIMDQPVIENGGPELGKLEALAGIRHRPERVKCATLAWHALKLALDESSEVAVTE